MVQASTVIWKQIEEAGVSVGKIGKVFLIAREAELADRTYVHKSRVMYYHVYS